MYIYVFNVLSWWVNYSFTLRLRRYKYIVPCIITWHRTIVNIGICIICNRGPGGLPDPSPEWNKCLEVKGNNNNRALKRMPCTMAMLQYGGIAEDYNFIRTKWNEWKTDLRKKIIIKTNCLINGKIISSKPCIQCIFF